MKNQDPSIVDLFRGYRPPGPGVPNPTPISLKTVARIINRTSTRSFELIPSRFDFSDILIESIRPDPTILARYLSTEYRHKDLILIDCAPTESILTQAAYHASGKVLVPVRPEFFATIGFPLLRQSLTKFRRANQTHKIQVCGVVINNGFYHGGNNGGPEKTRAIIEIRAEANKNRWTIFRNEIPFSRGFPKLMRGDNSYSGNAGQFYHFANEFCMKVGL